MINRLADRGTQFKSSSEDAIGGLDISRLNSAEFKKYMSSLEALVLRNPGPALASAFIVGVLVAWWIKRK